MSEIVKGAKVQVFKDQIHCTRLEGIGTGKLWIKSRGESTRLVDAGEVTPC